MDKVKRDGRVTLRIEARLRTWLLKEAIRKDKTLSALIHAYLDAARAQDGR